MCFEYVCVVIMLDIFFGVSKLKIMFIIVNVCVFWYMNIFKIKKRVVKWMKI